MTDKILTDYLEDMVTYSKDAIEFSSGLSLDNFKKDKKTIYAVTRAIEIIGEAAKKIPNDYRLKHPDILWSDVVGMRDKLVHDYTGVDIETVWKTATEDIPSLLKKLEKLV